MMFKVQGDYKRQWCESVGVGWGGVGRGGVGWGRVGWQVNMNAPESYAWLAVWHPPP
jgi:hypothetical protein